MSIRPTLQEQLQSNLGGNLNKKFGMTLPVPFIENITIDEAGENITVKAAMYFNMDDYGDLNFGDFTGSLGDLNFYAMLAFNREYAATTGSAMTSDNHLSELIDGHAEILSKTAFSWEFKEEAGTSTVAYYPGVSLFTHSHPNIYSFNTIAEWELVDTYYNDSGTPVKKLLAEVDIPVSDFIISHNFSPTDDNFLDYIEGNSTNTTSRQTINDVGFLTFSSVLQLGAAEDLLETLWEDLWAKNTSTPNDPMIDFYSSMTSDINSFVFFKDGSITPPDRTIFVTSGGTIVEYPIMGLDLRYHYSDKITISDLIAYFKPLTGSSADATLQTMIDSLLTILETNGDDPQLLVKINTFLQSFADKSSATAIGQFYGRVLERLTKANTAVIKGPRASKQLVNNPTVIDLRGSAATSTYEPLDDTIVGGKYIYQKSFYINREKGSIDDTAHLVDQGSFFFDYDKLLKEKSNIAQYFDVQKLEDLFGSEALCNRFYMESIKMSLVNTDDSTELASIETHFDTGHDQSGMAQNPNIPDQTMTITTDGTESYSLNSTLGEPYLYLRNFNLMNEIGEPGLDTLNNGRFYKLMCFQYKHVISGGGEDFNYRKDYGYSIDIEVRDSTNTIYIDLYNLAYEIQQLLLEYYDLASEACSYNETDDFFNQFFIKGVEARYAENPAESPWIKAAFMYTYLEDLWDNSYGGVRAEILIQAKNLSATVGPDGGTLVALKNLRNNYNILMGKLFDAELVVDTTFTEKSMHGDLGAGAKGFDLHRLNVEKTSGFPDPITGAWDGASASDEEEDTTADGWQEQTGYVEFDFGSNFDNWINNDKNDLWDRLVDKTDEAIWPFDDSLADDDDFGKEGPVFDEITSHIEAYDAKLGDKIYILYTTAYEAVASASFDFIIYRVAVHESEGKVKIRPFTFSGSGQQAVDTGIPGSTAEAPSLYTLDNY